VSTAGSGVAVGREAAEPFASRAEARPLRVLHVITRLIVGGAQENTLLSCALIDRRRFPSEIVSGPETGSEGSLHEECRRRGVRVHIEPYLLRRIHPLADLVSLVRLHAFIRRGRYDVVHTHASKAGVTGRIAAWLAGTPVVVHTAHGWAFDREEPPLIHAFQVAIERLCAAFCQAIVVVAEADRRRGLALGIGRPAQYALIRSGIELARYRDLSIDRAALRMSLGIPDEAFVVGTVGRLARQKSPLDLLDAFVRLAARRPESHLVMVGDGPLRPEVEAAARQARVEARVHLLGLRHDVPALLRAFDVMALASRWEGLPRVFPQAMAAGLPIVATRVNGAPDAIAHGENGWLVDVGDMADMARRLESLAADPALARRMGAAGRARVDEFSAERMADLLADLYATLAARRRR
jgi:glycosyltransferase involved in cell wall biosynthesis